MDKQTRWALAAALFSVGLSCGMALTGLVLYVL